MIQNTQTGKRYIGSAVNLKKRLSHHANALRLGYSINRKIDADIEAGFSDFSFSVLVSFNDCEITNCELSRREQDFIQRLGTTEEYNYQGASIRSRLKPHSLCCAHGSILLEGGGKGRAK